MKAPDRKCQMVVDRTCDENGDPDGDIECGERADWVGLDGILACQGCYSEHDAQDRAPFRWLDNERTLPSNQSTPGKEQT